MLHDPYQNIILASRINYDYTAIPDFIIRSHVFYNYKQNILWFQMDFWEDYYSIIDSKHHKYLALI